MAEVQLEKVTKIYPGDIKAVDAVTLNIADREFVVLVGPSGCGKSTTLRMIAGLEEITDGRIRIGQRVVNDVAPKDRDIAMVFQSYALYPHMTVYDNMAFGLKLRKTPKDEIKRRVHEAAQMLSAENLLDRKPRELSGGQRQRVALGRAIVREPAVFLMDEPLSNLDAKLRVQTRAEIARLHQRLGTTTVYVTHDQVEAMTMGERIAVMSEARLQQVGSPQALYDHPDNRFVAGFIGSPSMNLYEANVVVGGDDSLKITLGSTELSAPASALAARPALRGYDGGKLIVGVRPEDMEDASLEPEHPADQRLSARVALVESLGAEIMVHFNIDAVAFDAGDPDAIEEVGADDGESRCVARFNPRSQVRLGDPLEVAVSTERLHYFDPDTGLAVGG